MSNVIYGTKSLGGRIQQWQGPGTPNTNHVGSYFTGGHGAEPARVRASIKELRALYRRLDLNTPQADVEHLSKVIRDLEALLPRDNPSRKTGVRSRSNVPDAMLGVLEPHRPTKTAIAEAMKQIPKSEIDFLVGRFHVSEEPSVVEADMRKRAVRAKWPAAAIEASVQYAVKQHAANLQMYQDVMGGRIGSGKRR